MTGNEGPSATLAGRPLAYRLVFAAVTGPLERVRPEWHADDLAAVPSGSARLAVMQSVALAAIFVHRVAEVEGRDPADVLEDVWSIERSAIDWSPDL